MFNKDFDIIVICCLSIQEDESKSRLQKVPNTGLFEQWNSTNYG